MQLAAFSLRNLRYLRENKHARVLNISAQRNPNMSLADHADDRRRNPTTTLTAQTVFLCEIMQLAAFPLRDLRNLRENIHIRVLKIYCTNETPMSPADLADDADEPQTAKQQKPHHTNLSFSAE